MGLRQQQDLLARLYTDPALRERFRKTPQVVCGEFGLSTGEAADLSALAYAEVDRFADSLVKKRLREVEKLLPVSTRMLSDQLEPLFWKFSNRFNPRSVKKHLEDTLAFCDWIFRENYIEGHFADVMRFESTRLRHYAMGRRVSLCRLAHDVRPLFDHGREKAEIEFDARKNVAIWFRIGRRTRTFFIWFS